jgi:hypothetical protein
MARRRLPPRISRMFTRRLQYSRFKNTAKTSTDRSNDTVMSTFEKLFVTPVKINNTTGFGQNVAENEIKRKTAGLFPKGFTVNGRSFTDHIIAQVPKTIKNNGISLTTELMNTHTMIESNGAPADSSSKRGMLWWDDSGGTLSIYNNNAWLKLTGAIVTPPAGENTSPNDEWYGDRGLNVGGYQGSGQSKNRIEYYTISTTGNSSDFGDLTYEQSGPMAVTGDVSTRAVIAGGNTGANGNTIEYITTTTTGNATDFGDLITGRYRGFGFSSGSKGVFGNGLTSSAPSTRVNSVEYVTIATTGNATDFGDATAAVNLVSGAGDGATGLAFGGHNGTSEVNTIDKYTIATPGNATDFGNLTVAKTAVAACSNQSRALVGGGYTGSTYYNVIEYVTIATPGNGTDFGDLVSAGAIFAGTANGTRGTFHGRFTGGTFNRAIDYVTIATTGNASDLGDLLGSGYYDNAACSGDAS